jgi:hypothetical protein
VIFLVFIFTHFGSLWLIPHITGFAPRQSLTSEVIPFFGMLPQAHDLLSRAHLTVVDDLSRLPVAPRGGERVSLLNQGHLLDEDDLGYEGVKDEEEPPFSQEAAAVDKTPMKEPPMYLLDDDIDDDDDD